MGRTPREVSLVVSCEHARADVPPELAGLGLPPAVLQSHRGSDIGALPVARMLARALGRPLHIGRWSRLVVDLNREADNPLVIARRVDGLAVPGNVDLTTAERRRRLDRYWSAYRRDVEADVAAAVARGCCWHLSVHSFVERLGGVERGNDIGLLYDPMRPRERALVDDLRRVLIGEGLSVRRNFPYFGDTDAFTTSLRQQLPAARYLGIEIELNQRMARQADGQRRLGAALVAAVEAAIRG